MRRGRDSFSYCSRAQINSFRPLPAPLGAWCMATEARLRFPQRPTAWAPSTTRPFPNAPLPHELAGVFFFASNTTLFSYSFRSLTNSWYASDWAGEFGFGVSSRS